MAFIAASLLFRDDGLDFGETKPGFTALTDGRLHVETFDEHPVCLMEADEVAALSRYSNSSRLRPLKWLSGHSCRGFLARALTRINEFARSSYPDINDLWAALDEVGYAE